MRLRVWNPIKQAWEGIVAIRGEKGDPGGAQTVNGLPFDGQGEITIDAGDIKMDKTEPESFMIRGAILDIVARIVGIITNINGVQGQDGAAVIDASEIPLDKYEEVEPGEPQYTIKQCINDMDTAMLAKSGGTMAGILYAQNNTDYTTGQVRNVFQSTSDPTSEYGGNGDIWIKYFN
jgi:hypothetical protein